MKRSLIPEAVVHDEGDLEIRMGDVAVKMPVEDWLSCALLPRSPLLVAGASLFQVLQAKQQRDNNWSIGKIAEYHDVSKRTVHRWFRRIGVPAAHDNRQRQYLELRKKAKRMAGEGHGREAIADALGVAPTTVSDWVLRVTP